MPLSVTFLPFCHFSQECVKNGHDDAQSGMLSTGTAAPRPPCTKIPVSLLVDNSSTEEPSRKSETVEERQGDGRVSITRFTVGRAERC